MADWPTLGDGGQLLSTASTTGIGIASGALSHVKGLWTTLATTTSPRSGMIVHLSAAGASQFLIDIAMETTTSPQTSIIENLYYGGLATRAGHSVYLPVQIPSNATISARAQCLTAAGTISLHVTLVGAGMLPSQPLGFIRSHGTVDGTSGGTLLTIVTTNIEGAAVTLPLERRTQASSSVTVEPYSAFLFAIGGQGSTSRRSGLHYMTLYVNGTAFLSNVPATETLSDDSLYQLYYGPYPCAIPAGSTITASQRFTGTASGSTALDMCFYGVV